MKVLNPKSLSQEEIVERLNILRHKVYEAEIERVWTQFEKAGFEPILIKGWAAAQLYPRPFQRLSADIDLMIEPGHFDKALKFSENLRSRFPIDLHKGARHHDRLSFEDLFSNSVLVRCGASQIRLLRPEDHLRILCVHWLTDGGAYRERLWDIYHAIGNRPENFDWKRLLDAGGARRRRWIVCTIGLAHQYLGLNIKDTPLVEEAKILPRWLKRAVEKEWESEVRLQPLHYFLHNKKELWRQIKKRIPPNPIQATIELEGEFDDKPRIGYQLKSVFPRLVPSVKRIYKTLFVK